jgi:hypothetical protein
MDIVTDEMDICFAEVEASAGGPNEPSVAKKDLRIRTLTRKSTLDLTKGVEDLNPHAVGPAPHILGPGKKGKKKGGEKKKTKKEGKKRRNKNEEEEKNDEGEEEKKNATVVSFRWLPFPTGLCPKTWTVVAAAIADRWSALTLPFFTSTGERSWVPVGVILCSTVKPA